MHLPILYRSLGRVRSHPWNTLIVSHSVLAIREIFFHSLEIGFSDRFFLGWCATHRSFFNFRFCSPLRIVGGGKRSLLCLLTCLKEMKWQLQDFLLLLPERNTVCLLRSVHHEFLTFSFGFCNCRPLNSYKYLWWVKNTIVVPLWCVTPSKGFNKAPWGTSH